MNVQQVQDDVQNELVEARSFWARLKDAVKNHFVPEAVHFYKLLSVWMFIAITSAPEAYQAAGALGLLTIETVPDKFKWLVRAIGIVGLYVRLVNQNVSAKIAADQASSK